MSAPMTLPGRKRLEVSCHRVIIMVLEIVMPVRSLHESTKNFRTNGLRRDIMLAMIPT